MTASPQTPTELANHALEAFERVVGHTNGFRQRPGQHTMAQAIAQAMSVADLGEHPTPTQSIVVVQAGTGVGKSAAYAATTISMAVQRKTRVILSTATVALQEQLMEKDLPALAQTLDVPFNFALAKGRGRYVCHIKLERLAGSESPLDDMFDDAPEPSISAHTEAQHAHRVRLYTSMHQALTAGQWDGDRDTLAETPEASEWSAVAAERHTCTVRHCPRFGVCSYYRARSRLAEAQVIVANHDLVLSSLGMKTLPELDRSLVVFDEGHHLPAVALHQFSSNTDLTSLRWLDRLPKTMNEVASRLYLSTSEDVQTLCSDIKAGLTQLARTGLDLVWEHTGRNARGEGVDGIRRFANGQVPEALMEPVHLLHAQSQALSRALDSLAAQVKALAKEDTSQATLCAQLYAQLGALAPRLSSLVSTCALWLEHGEQPLAKWLEVDSQHGFVHVIAHACPIVPGDLLRQHLWSQVRAAVVTSASLTSCGSFDFFLREAGLSGKASVQALEVPSPFNYTRQGSLTVVHTRADPKSATAFTEEMVAALMADLEQVHHGALVLFTSRAQMRAATDAIPGHLLDMVLVQGTQSRTRLLAAHTQRVESGLPSVLFGLQSFGEGLDLPGQLCETLLIAKLPFASPSDPVDEARAEWLKTLGRDAFSELVIPATGVRLLQWTGRAIRTEDDEAHIICYDRRLTQTPYGRRLLSGLPPYRQLQRQLGLETAVEPGRVGRHGMG